MQTAGVLPDVTYFYAAQASWRPSRVPVSSETLVRGCRSAKPASRYPRLSFQDPCQGARPSHALSPTNSPFGSTTSQTIALG